MRKNLVVGFSVVFLIILVSLLWQFRTSIPLSPKQDESSTTEVEEEEVLSLSESITIDGIQKTKVVDTTITIENEYQKKSSYTSYIASYIVNGIGVNGLLTVPNQDKPAAGFPAIVFLHGYIPPADYQTKSGYENYVDYLAENGFVVFKIDYRGHGESGGMATGAYFSADYVIDTLAAVNALQHHDQVNPKAIGVWGHSMSGNVALRAAVVQPAIKAVVIWAGAVYSYEDFLTYRIQDSSFVRESVQTQSVVSQSQQIIEKEGDVDMSKPFWRSVAPTNYLDRLAAPIQLHHSTDDDVVTIKYSQDLVAALEKADKPHELNEYSTGGHNLRGASFGKAMERTVDFFSTHLD